MSEPLHDEVLDGLPVLPEEQSSGHTMLPASGSRLAGPLPLPVQTVAAAAGGFVAGAAVLGLVRRRHGKRLALASPPAARRIGRRSSKRSKQVGQLVEVVATRSLLVDIHVLGASGADR